VTGSALAPPPGGGSDRRIGRSLMHGASVDLDRRLHQPELRFGDHPAVDEPKPARGKIIADQRSQTVPPDGQRAVGEPTEFGSLGEKPRRRYRLTNVGGPAGWLARCHPRQATGRREDLDETGQAPPIVHTSERAYGARRDARRRGQATQDVASPHPKPHTPISRVPVERSPCRSEWRTFTVTFRELLRITGRERPDIQRWLR
jgi:hypothetical protein